MGSSANDEHAIYTGYHLTAEQQTHHDDPTLSCAYVGLFGNDVVRSHSEDSSGSGLTSANSSLEEPSSDALITYDSKHYYCSVRDLDSQTHCCRPTGRLPIEKELTSEACDENTNCCTGMPQCVAHCSKEHFYNRMLQQLSEESKRSKKLKDAAL